MRGNCLDLDFWEELVKENFYSEKDFQIQALRQAGEGQAGVLTGLLCRIQILFVFDMSWLKIFFIIKPPEKAKKTDLRARFGQEIIL